MIQIDFKKVLKGVRQESNYHQKSLGHDSNP